MKKLLVAFAVGMALGIVIAPDKGSETVRKLKKRGNDLKDQIKDHIDDLAVNAKSFINKEV